ncbi:MAG TPA: alpha/beta hydrolase [Ktedonobacteraceae bacterium]|jgi:pimeloyl-ACP methyl ester carboxylesterase|nr:alpha/beta hydrolase [Ktedonobacteraceae bacterium]
MTSTLLLAGIAQHVIKTDRLRTAYLEAGNGNVPLVLVHGNCSSSLFFQDFMLALAAMERYKIYAPDLRGYGDTETVPVDATRGLADFSDDLAAFVRALNLSHFHLFGWSLGGNVALQYAIDYPGALRSLTLQSTGSPFGFGGTKGAEGTPTWPDYAGSGGGTANPAFVQAIAQGDRGDGQASPRTVMNTFYFKPPFRAAPDREEIYVSSLLSTKTTPGNYPGDSVTSPNWPNVAPGTQGVNNALSPKYMNQGNFATINTKPPVLWIHGSDDQIVSDTSLFDFGFLGQLGAVPGWPGAETYPPQPMKTQVRTVLERYRANGGAYREVALPDCGHSPHIEKQDEVVGLFSEFVDSQR